MKSFTELRSIWRIAKTIYSGGAVIANMESGYPFRVSSEVVGLTCYNLNYNPKSRIRISVDGIDEQICTTKCRTKACTNAKHL